MISASAAPSACGTSPDGEVRRYCLFVFHVKHADELQRFLRFLKALKVLRFLTSMNTARGYRLDKTLKVLRLLRFLACASSGKSSLSVGRTFEPMNLRTFFENVSRETFL